MLDTSQNYMPPDVYDGIPTIVTTYVAIIAKISIFAFVSELVFYTDVISIFLSIELQSYGVYILSTLYRDSESATASGLTYFLLGGLSSCFILLGSALIYANSGTTSLDNVYIITGISEITDLPMMMHWYQPSYLHFSLIIMSVGFFAKQMILSAALDSGYVFMALVAILTSVIGAAYYLNIIKQLFFLKRLAEYNLS